MTVLKFTPKPPQREERTFGSRKFISRTRLPDTPGPTKFEPTRKADGDVVI